MYSNKVIITKKILFVYNNADIFLNSIIGIQLILITMYIFYVVAYNSYVILY